MLLELYRWVSRQPVHQELVDKQKLFVDLVRPPDELNKVGMPQLAQNAHLRDVYLYPLCASDPFDCHMEPSIVEEPSVETPDAGHAELHLVGESICCLPQFVATEYMNPFGRTTPWGITGIRKKVQQIEFYLEFFICFTNYFRDISSYIAPSNHDMNSTRLKVKDRTPLFSWQKIPQFFNPIHLF